MSTFRGFTSENFVVQVGQVTFLETRSTLNISTTSESFLTKRPVSYWTRFTPVKPVRTCSQSKLERERETAGVYFSKISNYIIPVTRQLSLFLDQEVLRPPPGTHDSRKKDRGYVLT